jgi:hypothetical protein
MDAPAVPVLPVVATPLPALPLVIDEPPVDVPPADVPPARAPPDPALVGAPPDPPLGGEKKSECSPLPQARTSHAADPHTAEKIRRLNMLSLRLNHHHSAFDALSEIADIARAQTGTETDVGRTGLFRDIPLTHHAPTVAFRLE